METDISTFVLSFIGGNSVPTSYTMSDALADISNIKADRDGDMPEWLTAQTLYDEMQKVIHEASEHDAD